MNPGSARSAPAAQRSRIDALVEVAFYVDMTFFFEDEESTTPMTWMWDTSALPPGPHLLTVNVFSYDGRIGCLTLHGLAPDVDRDRVVEQAIEERGGEHGVPEPLRAPYAHFQVETLPLPYGLPV